MIFRLFFRSKIRLPINRRFIMALLGDSNLPFEPTKQISPRCTVYDISYIHIIWSRTIWVRGIFIVITTLEWIRFFSTWLIRFTSFHFKLSYKLFRLVSIIRMAFWKHNPNLKTSIDSLILDSLLSKKKSSFMKKSARSIAASIFIKICEWKKFENRRMSVYLKKL